jgi:hypothetical protein
MRESVPLQIISMLSASIVFERTRGTVEVSQIQRVRVVGLPCREEHGEHRDEGSECANLCRAVTNCGALQKTGQSAVEGVNSVAAYVNMVLLAHLVVFSRTRRAPLADSMCRYDALAFRRRCPLWSTWGFTLAHANSKVECNAPYIHMPNAKL